VGDTGTSSSSNHTNTNNKTTPSSPSVNTTQLKYLRNETNTLHRQGRSVQELIIQLAQSIHMPDLLLNDLLNPPYGLLQLENSNAAAKVATVVKMRKRGLLVDERDVLQEDWLRRLSSNQFDLTNVLVDTEEEYIQLCSSLRQMVAGWASLRTKYKGRKYKLYDLFPIAQVNSKGHLLSSSTMDHSTNGSFDLFPCANAEFYVEQLERLRTVRVLLMDTAMALELKEERERYGGPTNLLAKFLPTSLSQVLNLNESMESESKLKLKALTAHISPNCTTNTTLYREVIRSHLYWEYIKGDNPFFSESWTKCAQHLQSIAYRMNQHYDNGNGNPHVQPDKEAIHLVLQGAQYSKDLKSAQTCMDMIMGPSLRNQAGPSTFLALLNIFQNVARHSKKNEERRIALDIAMVLVKTLKEEIGKVDAGADPDSAVAANSGVDLAQAYYSTLSILRYVGKKGLPGPEYTERIDALMEDFIGKEKYTISTTRWARRRLVERHGGLPVFDCRLMENLIEAFARSGEDKNIRKATILLNWASLAQEEKRNILSKKHEEENKNDVDNFEWNEEYPRVSTCSAVLHALLHRLKEEDKSEAMLSSNEKHEAKNNKYFALKIYRNIKERDLDLDLKFYHILLRLLAGPGTMPKIGQIGEELLSDIEIRSFSSSDNQERPILFTYYCVLECWVQSAASGLPDSARNAYDLVQRMEAKSKQSNLIWDDNDNAVRGELDIIYEKELLGNSKKSHVYLSLIKACSNTSHKPDMEYALNLAFETHNTMVERNIPRTSRHYAELLSCCTFDVLDNRRRLELSKAVFSQACDEGMVSRFVLLNLKRANYPLFEVFEAKPHYSASVGGDVQKVGAASAKLS
jgi:hypothetical protein